MLVELEHQGCAAAGYRLTGEMLDHICCRHLSRDARMLIMWPVEEEAADTVADALDQAVRRR